MQEQKPQIRWVRINVRGFRSREKLAELAKVVKTLVKSTSDISTYDAFIVEGKVIYITHASHLLGHARKTSVIEGLIYDKVEPINKKVARTYPCGFLVEVEYVKSPWRSYD